MAKASRVAARTEKHLAAQSQQVAEQTALLRAIAEKLGIDVRAVTGGGTLVNGGVIGAPNAPTVTEANTPEEDNTPEVDLDSLSAAQLKALADEHGVELPGKATVHQARDILRAFFDAQSAAGEME
jgi:hypothetical protein